MTSPIQLHNAADVFSIVSAFENFAFPKLTAVRSGDKFPILFTASPINRSRYFLEPFFPNSFISCPELFSNNKCPSPSSIPPPTAIPPR